MKKLFVILIATLLVGGVAFGEGVPQPSAVGVSRIKAVGTLPSDPQSQILLVRYGNRFADSAKISSGDVVVWDLNSADGVTISQCVVANAVSYAGVAVTDILTATNSSVDPNDRNWGYIAVKGYCLAKVDTSDAVTGGVLSTDGNITPGALGTGIIPNGALSVDIGVLLNDTGSDGLMPVYLR